MSRALQVIWWHSRLITQCSTNEAPPTSTTMGKQSLTHTINTTLSRHSLSPIRKLTLNFFTYITSVTPLLTCHSVIPEGRRTIAFTTPEIRFQEHDIHKAIHTMMKKPFKATCSWRKWVKSKNRMEPWGNRGIEARKEEVKGWMNEGECPWRKHWLRAMREGARGGRGRLISEHIRERRRKGRWNVEKESRTKRSEREKKNMPEKEEVEREEETWRMVTRSEKEKKRYEKEKLRGKEEARTAKEDTRRIVMNGAQEDDIAEWGSNKMDKGRRK